MRWWVTLNVVVVCCAGVALAGGAGPVALAEFQQANPGVQVYESNGHLARIYGAPFSFGVSPEDAADAFVRAQSQVFGVSSAELLAGNEFSGLYTQPLMYQAESGTYKFTLIYYTQYRDGLRVYGGGLRLLALNGDGYPIVWAGSTLRNLGAFSVPAGAAANVAEGDAHAAAAREFPGLINFSAAEVVVYAGVEGAAASPAVALVFVGDDGAADRGAVLKRRIVADAATGAILHSENLIVHTDVNGSVSGMATVGPKAEQCSPEALMPMKYAKVGIGTTTAYADMMGSFVIPNSGSDPVTVTSWMSGRYFAVDNYAGAEETLTTTVTPPGPATFVHNAPNTNEAILAQVNGYIQANVVRDFCLTYNPAYPTISTDLNFPVYVNRSDGYCPGNAWYDGSSINFCARSGTSYGNTAYSNIIHHEYGHHMVAAGGSGQDQYGEGMSDSIGVLIADDPVCGYGFYYTDCAAGIRTAVNTMQYPCSGEIHECGQLISGCIWSTRNALAVNYPVTYLQILGDLTVNSILLHSGGTIAPDITIDFLTLDDDDGNIGNGTPHYAEICAGFNAHNMDCPALQLLDIRFPNGKPEFVSPAGGTTVRVEVLPISAQPQPGSGMFYYKLGSGAWQNVAMTEVAPNVYDAVFPAVACPTVVKYYFSARTMLNQTVYSPSDAPTNAYATISAYGLITPFAFDFDAAGDEGWARGDTGDNATTGLWNRADPEPTAAQPGDDHSPAPGVKCWVTDHRAGNSIGEWDVDGGKTTIKSPVFDLTAYTGVKVSYWRWYSNDQGGSPNADTFRVGVTNNNGTSWVTAETVGPTGPQTAGGWYYHEFYVTDFVPLTNQIRFRFVAEDAGSGSIIEAALDDFKIEAVVCTPTFTVGDLNCDGAVNFDDINPFVLAIGDPAGYQAEYPNCDILLADCNGDGVVNFDDINPFVALLSQ